MSSVMMSRRTLAAKSAAMAAGASRAEHLRRLRTADLGVNPELVRINDVRPGRGWERPLLHLECRHRVGNDRLDTLQQGQTAARVDDTAQQVHRGPIGGNVRGVR